MRRRSRDHCAALQHIQAQQIVTAEGASVTLTSSPSLGSRASTRSARCSCEADCNLGTSSYFPGRAIAEPEEALSPFS